MAATRRRWEATATNLTNDVDDVASREAPTEVRLRPHRRRGRRDIADEGEAWNLGIGCWWGAMSSSMTMS
jgi:hypothetical protein